MTSKKNGASIFLPAAGVRARTSLNFADDFGRYWDAAPNVSPV